MADLSTTAIADMRVDYRAGSLRRADLADCPIRQFENWFSQARAAKIKDANAMTLSTVGKGGVPTSRTVLMKDLTQDGLRFFTNYKSRKAKEIAHCQSVALSFFWPLLERQVQILGECEKLSREESREYFYSRPYDSRIGAWASTQSQEISDRGWLEERMQFFSEKYPETKEADCVPLPDFWGGYIVDPVSFEFWQGQPGRCHDRFLYQKREGCWAIQRLSP